MFRKRTLPSASAAEGSAKRPVVREASLSEDEDEVFTVDRTKARSAVALPRATFVAEPNQKPTVMRTVGADDPDGKEKTDSSTEILPEIRKGEKSNISNCPLSNLESSEYTDYSMEGLAALKQAQQKAAFIPDEKDTNSKSTDAGKPQELPQPEILSGEAAEELMEESDGQEESDNKQFPSYIPLSNERGKDNESFPIDATVHVYDQEMLSSASESEVDVDSNWYSRNEGKDSQSASATPASNEESPSTLILELRTLYQRLEVRKTELGRTVLQGSSLPQSNNGDNAKNKEQLLILATNRQKRLAELKQYLRALVACLRFKLCVMLNMTDIDELHNIWDDVKEDFSNPQKIAQKFAWWEQEDPQEFTRILPDIGDLFAPFLLWRMLCDEHYTISYSLPVVDWVEIKDAVRFFKIEDTRIKIAKRAALLALEKFPYKSDEMHEVQRKVENDM